MNVKYFLIIAISFLLISSSFAQDDSNKKTSKKGLIKGIVCDNDSGLPLNEATVKVFWEVDTSLANGSQTDKSGAFAVEVPYGKFKLRVEYIGYKNFVKRKIAVTPKNPEVAIDTIFLIAGYTTEEIEVQDEKPFMENQIDKKVYNVEKSIVNTGGTVIDALKNIPSVTVDSDNKVYLRGSSNVKIQINGMPSAMLSNDPGTVLEQMPSNLIESVEIINNPSSKYDPEGTSGIINIILKRKQDDGYNVGLNLNAGTKDKYSSSFNFSARKNKFIFNGSYNYRLNNMLGTGTLNRETIIFDSTFTYNQNSNSRDKMESHFGSFGIDYEPSKINIFSLSTNFNLRDRYNLDKSFNENINPSGISTLVYNKEAIRDGKSYSIDINATHKHKFDRPKEELNSSFSFSKNHDKNPNSILQTDYNTGFIQLYQNDSTTSDMSFFTIQSDYTKPLGDYNPMGNFNPMGNTGPPQMGRGFNPMESNSSSTGTPGSQKFEAGIKAAFRNMSSDYNSNYFNTISQSWIYNSLTSNNFDYQDKIFSAYSNYANKFFGLGYQVGLRLEEALTKSTQLTLNQNYENNYFSFFPSVYLLKSITPTNEIQASYSRRINRPNIFQLNPFTDYSDPQNLRKGNPNLKPEYINAFELSYNKYFPNLLATGTVFYRRINDVINRVFTIIDSTTSITSFDNISNSSSYGLEFILGGSITKWWMLNGSISYSKTTVSGNSSQGVLENSGDAWSGKMMNSFNFKNLFDLQISYFYMGKMIQAQGSMNPIQMLDVAIKKDFFNKLASLTFRVSDPFNAMKFSLVSNGSNYNLNFNRKRDSRVAYLTLAIRLGSEPIRQQRRQREQQPNENQREDF
jgi:outer membrane receptor protein involved in Fe transport